MGVRLVVRSSWTQRSDPAEAQYDFQQPRVVIGRSAGADVQLPHPAVSATHASIRAEGARWVLVDEGSTNGTSVNGKKLVPRRPKPLRENDLIEAGGFTLRVELGVLATPTSAEKTAELARRLIRDALSGSTSVEPPRLRILNGTDEGTLFELPPAPSSVVIGRGETCDLSVSDEDASREHVEIVRTRGIVRIRDLDSKNGFSVNGAPLLEAELKDRDEVQLGNTILSYEDPAGAAVQAVVNEPDLEVVPPPPPSEPEPEPEPHADPATDATASETEPIESRVLQPRPKARAPADLVVYVLAGAVLALSIAGLVWLFGT